MQDDREEIQAGEGWAILLIVVLTLVACVSAAVDVASKVPQ